MVTEDALQRGQRWHAFYEEDGGLKDMLDLIGETYLARMSDIEPWETGKLAKLAMANKIAAQLRGLILDVIGSGDIAAAAKKRRAQIEALPERKRRLLGMME